MSVDSARDEFVAEVGAWGNLIQSRANAASTGESAPGDAESDYRLATRILRGGRLVYGYSYLFAIVGVCITVLAIVGAILMVARLRV